MERESHEGKKRESATEAERSGKEQATEEKAGERKTERVTPRTLAEQAVKRRRTERGT